MISLIQFNAKLKDKANHMLFVLRGSCTIPASTDEWRSTVCIHYNILANMCIYYNNYVANRYLKHFDGVSFRYLFVRIRIHFKKIRHVSP